MPNKLNKFQMRIIRKHTVKPNDVNKEDIKPKETFKDKMTRMADEYAAQKIDITMEMTSIKNLIKNAYMARKFLIKIVPAYSNGYAIGYMRGTTMYEFMVLENYKGREKEICNTIIEELKELGFDPQIIEQDEEHINITIEW